MIVTDAAGRLCEVDIDDCVGDPCQHDGTCDDHPNGFTCRCLPGFDGELCSETISHVNNVTNSTHVIEEPLEDRWYDQASHVQLCTVKGNVRTGRINKRRLFVPDPFYWTFR